MWFAVFMCLIGSCFDLFVSGLLLLGFVVFVCWFVYYMFSSLFVAVFCCWFVVVICVFVCFVVLLLVAVTLCGCYLRFGLIVL